MIPDDLSRTHQSVSSLFRAWADSRDVARFRLTDEQLRHYDQHGYVAGIPILTGAECDALCEELAELVDPGHPQHGLFHEFHSNESTTPGTVLFHALGAWRIAPGFHDLLWHPAVTVPASQLLGGSVRLWHDQLFCKPARDGGVVAWHQDYSYWTRTKPLMHLTCWIGLDPSTRENGCVHYIPGSHRWNLLPLSELAGDMNEIRKVLTPEQIEVFEQPVAVELARGCASFHHPLIIHGSFENRTKIPRRATVVNFIRDGVVSDSDEPLLKDVPVIPWGEPLAGRFFPLLFDRSAAADA